jgi:hypothetical protein
MRIRNNRDAEPKPSSQVSFRRSNPPHYYPALGNGPILAKNAGYLYTPFYLTKPDFIKQHFSINRRDLNE